MSDRHAEYEWQLQHAEPTTTPSGWLAVSTCRRPRKGWLARLLGL